MKHFLSAFKIWFRTCFLFCVWAHIIVWFV